MEQISNTPFMKKMTKNISEYMHNRYPVVPPIQQYLFIEDGNQILVYKGEGNLLSLLEPENYDFVIRNDYCKIKRNGKSKWINNKIIYQNLRDCGEYEVSNLSFLSFVVFYENQLIDIQLNTDTYTYMIVGNRINKKFIFYLLKNMGMQVDYDFDYNIQIITNNVDVLQLNSTQELIICKNKFLI